MPSKLAEQLLEQLERLDVEVVGRLVEHQHVRRPGEQPRQQQAVALAAGQRSHRRLRALAREQEVREVADDVPRLAVDDDGGVAVADAVGDRRVGIELLALLIEVGDLQPGAAPHLARVGLQLAEQQPQQRRLAGAVRADQADAIAAQDALREVADDRRAAERLRHVLRLEHQLPERLPVVDGEPHVAGLRAYAARSARSAISARTRPSLRVRRALTPCRSHASSCASFLSSRSSSRASASSAAVLLLEVARVAARPRREPAAIELDDARGERGEEGAVVGDEQERAGIAAQVLLEPADRVDVEMVGRLVEQQQVRLGDQRAAEQRAAAPAAGQLAHRPVGGQRRGARR